MLNIWMWAVFVCPDSSLLAVEVKCMHYQLMPCLCFACQFVLYMMHWKFIVQCRTRVKDETLPKSLYQRRTCCWSLAHALPSDALFLLCMSICFVHDALEVHRPVLNGGKGWDIAQITLPTQNLLLKFSACTTIWCLVFALHVNLFCTWCTGSSLQSAEER